MIGLFAGRWWWVFEIASHFPVYYALLAGIVTLLAIAFRRWRLARAAAAVLVVNLGVVLPLYWGRSPIKGDAQRVRLVSANVYTPNRQRDRFIERVREVDADVVLCMEVNDAWMKSLSVLKVEYPVIVSRPRRDNFGIAFFSRLPADRAEIVNLGPAEVPSVVAELRRGERRFTVIGTHPLPPTSRKYARLRNEQLQAVADYAAGVAGPVVVIGDLNVTPWSPYFRDLVKDSGLHDSTRGFGVQPTWAGVPIDHALCSGDVAVLGRRIGPPIGSDHRPLVVDVALPTAGPP